MLKETLAIACVSIATAAALPIGIGSAYADSSSISKQSSFTAQDSANAWALLKTAYPSKFTDEKLNAINQSPCADSITRLVVYGLNDRDVRETLDKARVGMTQPACLSSS